MSLRSYQSVWEGSSAKGNELLVLLAIAEHYNPEKGYAWPSIERIMGYARCSSPRTVEKHVKSLVRREELRVAYGGGRQNTNRYYLNFKKLKDQAEERNRYFNPAEFAGFEDKPRKSGSQDRQETPQIQVINPANPGPEFAGEGTNKQSKQKKGEEGPGTVDISPLPSDEEFCLDGLRELFPAAVKRLTKKEREAFGECVDDLAALDPEDWEALTCWFRLVDDKVRGRKVWPRSRGEFLENYAEAVEKVREWWSVKGSRWMEAKRRKLQREREETSPETEEKWSRDEALAFLKSEVNGKEVAK